MIEAKNESARPESSTTARPPRPPTLVSRRPRPFERPTRTPGRVARTIALALAITTATCLGNVPFIAAQSQPNQGQPNQAPSATAPAVSYPTTRRDDQVDMIHGVAVADPYRWLENPNSSETRAWIAAQNRVTNEYLGRSTQRDRLRHRLNQMWTYERYSIPHQRAGRYFYQRNDGRKNQPLLYVTDRLDANPRVLLDPNRLAADGSVALSGWRVSWNGEYIAYGLATGGSDWRTWRVRETRTGRELSDELRWLKYSDVSWAPDNGGFYYSRYDQPQPGTALTATTYNQKLYFHKLGDPQASDRLIYERADQKEWAFDGQVTEDGQLLVITVWSGTDRNTQVFARNLADPAAPVQELITGFDARYRLVAGRGNTIWLKTDAEAPLGRLIAVDVDRPAREHWKTVIPESSNVLIDVSLVGQRFIAHYLEHAASRIRVFHEDGAGEHDLRMPGFATFDGFDGLRADQETFYSVGSYTSPPTIFRYEVATGKSTVFQSPRVPFRAADYETTRVFYSSADGAKIPLMITMRRGVKPNGRLPVLLHGYGGFNISVTPAFSPSNMAWLEMGGVLAVPSLRGGGEYGRDWHAAGTRAGKRQVIEDFVAAARWLIDNGYTNPSRLAISGRSNGGMIVGAALTQHPELFAAALPGVGVFDMLRYHRFTIGWAWIPEYGSADDPEDFQTLLSYSPLHKIRPGTRYPATLITTADHDDRVVPAHSFKFAAALQAAQSGPAPILIRVETQAGHGGGIPANKVIDAAADSLAFLAEVLDIDDRGANP